MPLRMTSWLTCLLTLLSTTAAAALLVLVWCLFLAVAAVWDPWGHRLWVWLLWFT